MSADILMFPGRADPVMPDGKRACSPGDIVVTCINATIGLWCAWPVAEVDDDGVVIAVSRRDGRRIGVDRVNCQPTVYGLRAVDHQAVAFAGMRWRTWPDHGAALVDFAAISIPRTQQESAP
jgi:hypothetical protein